MASHRPSTSPLPQRPTKPDSSSVASKVPLATNADYGKNTVHEKVSTAESLIAPKPRSSARDWRLRFILLSSVFGNIFQARELIAPETTHQAYTTLEKALLCEEGTFCLSQTLREAVIKAQLFTLQSVSGLARSEETEGSAMANEQAERPSQAPAVKEVSAAYKQQSRLDEIKADANAVCRDTAAESCRTESAKQLQAATEAADATLEATKRAVIATTRAESAGQLQAAQKAAKAAEAQLETAKSAVIVATTAKDALASEVATLRSELEGTRRNSSRLRTEKEDSLVQLQAARDEHANLRQQLTEAEEAATYAISSKATLMALLAFACAFVCALWAGHRKGKEAEAKVAQAEAAVAQAKATAKEQTQTHAEELRKAVAEAEARAEAAGARRVSSQQETEQQESLMQLRMIERSFEQLRQMSPVGSARRSETAGHEGGPVQASVARVEAAEAALAAGREAETKAAAEKAAVETKAAEEKAAALAAAAAEAAEEKAAAEAKAAEEKAAALAVAAAKAAEEKAAVETKAAEEKAAALAAAAAKAAEEKAAAAAKAAEEKAAALAAAAAKAAEENAAAAAKAAEEKAAAETTVAEEKAKVEDLREQLKGAEKAKRKLHEQLTAQAAQQMPSTTSPESNRRSPQKIKPATSEAAEKPGPSEATQVEKAQKEQKPCDNYRVDMSASAQFGDCKCGWAKRDHTAEAHSPPLRKASFSAPRPDSPASIPSKMPSDGDTRTMRNEVEELKKRLDTANKEIEHFKSARAPPGRTCGVPLHTGAESGLDGDGASVGCMGSSSLSAPDDDRLIDVEKLINDDGQDSESANNVWSLVRWLQGAGVHNVVAEAMRRGFAANCVGTDSKGVLTFLRGLQVEEDVSRLLPQQTLHKAIIGTVWRGVKVLKEAEAASADELHEKYTTEKFMIDKYGKAFTLQLGGLNKFFQGLEGMVGPPNPQVLEGMRRDHCLFGDATTPFDMPNKKAKTTSTIEWRFVANPAGGVDERGTPFEPYPKKDSRQALTIEYFRRELKGRNDELAQIGQQPVDDNEFYGARLYTGPMYLKYNAVLRGLQFKDDTRLKGEFDKLCQGNKYTTTLHAINSAIIKLSKLTKAKLVYRGVSGGVLPDECRKPNSYGVRGGIEGGFMSTTSEKKIAVFYAKGGADKSKEGSSAILFEARMGMVDRGADVGWLSQFPQEDEILFAPLTGMEVRGSRVEGAVQIYEVVLTVNMLSLTIDEVIGKRQKLLKEIVGLAKQDVTNDLDGLEPERGVAKLDQSIAEKGFLTKDSMWYNEADNFETAVVGIGKAKREAANLPVLFSEIAKHKIKLEKAAPAIVQRLCSDTASTQEVRKAALDGLAKLGKAPLAEHADAIAAQLDPQDRGDVTLAALHAIGRLDAALLASHAAKIAGCTMSSLPQVCYKAMQIFETLDPEVRDDQLDAIMQCEKRHPNTVVRREASSILDRITSRGADGAAAPKSGPSNVQQGKYRLIRQQLESRDCNEREKGLGDLTRLKPSELVQFAQPLLRCLDDPNLGNKAGQIVKTLVPTGKLEEFKAAVPPDDPEVRSAANKLADKVRAERQD